MFKIRFFLSAILFLLFSFNALALTVDLNTPAATHNNASGSFTVIPPGSTMTSVHRSVDGGDWVALGGFTKFPAEIVEDNLPTGQYSYIAAVWFQETGHRDTSPIHTVNVLRPPGVPASITSPSTDNNGIFTVSWGTASGTITKYELYQQKNAGDWTLKHSGTARSKAISGLSDGSYIYRVRACETKNSFTACSAYRTAGATTVANKPGTPASITTPSTDNNGAFTVSWGTASGSVDKYQLYKQTNGGSWVSVYNGTSKSKAISGLADSSYKFRVRACNTYSTYTACGSYRTSGTTTVANKPGTPASIATPSMDANGAFTVTWGASSGNVDKYQLYQQENGGSWGGNIYSGTSRSKSVSGLSDAAYKYRVRACNTYSSYTSCSSHHTTCRNRPANIVVTKITAIRYDIPGRCCWCR